MRFTCLLFFDYLGFFFDTENYFHYIIIRFFSYLDPKNGVTKI